MHVLIQADSGEIGICIRTRMTYHSLRDVQPYRNRSRKVNLMEQLTEFIGNNLIWISLWFALLLLLIWNVAGNTLLGVSQIEPMEATRLLNHEHAALLDIRGAPEFAAGHILGATNIPEAELPQKKTELEKMKKKPLIVYCQNGLASPKIVRQLKTEGFTAVTLLRGGISTWQKAGLPLSRSTGRSGQVAES